MKNWSATQRASLQDTLNLETTGVLTIKNLVEDYERQQELKNAQVEDEVKKIEERWLLAKAAETRYDTPLPIQAYQEIETSRQLNQLEIEKKRAFNQADLDNELAVKRETVRLAIIAKHLSEHQKITLINEQLAGIYERIDEVEKSKLSDTVKTRMKEDLEETVSVFKESRRGIQTRLLEAHNGREIRGGDKATGLRGGDRRALEEDTNLR